MEKYRWDFGNSILENEEDATNSMADLCPISAICPLVPTTLLGEDDDEEDDAGIEMYKAEDNCIEWLEKQEPSSVVYVSFGSVIVLNSKQMESIATALKNCNHPFIWSVKQPDPKPADGSGQLPNWFLEELKIKKQGLVVSWSPQIKILAHQATACFVTHCGWNSTLETIAAGVPVIAYPQWPDQPTNAKLILDVFRVGLRLRRNQDGFVGNKELEECIREIMEGGKKAEELKYNAKKWKIAARQAVARGGSSDRNIQLFVDEIWRIRGANV